MSTDAGRGGAGGAGAGGKGGVIAQAAQRTMSPLTRQALRAGKAKGPLANRTAALQAATLAKAGVKAKPARSKSPAKGAALGKAGMLAIVGKLDAANISRPAFDSVMKDLRARSFGKADAVAVASIFTGARPTAFRTKGAAIEAIRQKFEERVYLAAKAKMNENVTPW